MMRKRRKHAYLVSGGEIPRRSLYRYRSKKAREAAERHAGTEVDCPNISADDSRDTVLNSEEDFLRSEPLSFDQLNKPSLSDDDDISLSSPSPSQDVSSALANNDSGYHNYDMLLSQDEDSQTYYIGQINEDGEYISEEEAGADAVCDEAAVCDKEAGNDEEADNEFGSDVFESDLNQLLSESDLHQLPHGTFPTISEDRYVEDKEFLLDRQLCRCSPTREGDALLYCLALGIRHNLTWVAMVDILKMVNLLYGYEAVTASKYYLQKLFYRQKSAKYHLYCSICETYLGVKDGTDTKSSCECSNDEVVDMSTSFFVSVDLADQFKTLLKRPEVANEIMTYRFQRKKLNENAYEDIFDGESYKTLCEDSDILGNPCNFSYTWNTDGVQMGKSSKNAAWPIFISINELSPQNRKRHMIFAGVWVGKSQPNMRIFLKPFVDEANRLSGDGFSWTDSQNIERHSKVFPLCCVVDSAARFKLLNLLSYTGYFGCTFCYQRAENTQKGRRFTIQDADAPLRTHESMIKDMNEVYKQRNNPDKKKRIIKGCKGYTPLALMNHLSLDKSFVVDSMHNSYLGVAKSHTGNLLLTCRTEFYIGSPEKMYALDAVLCYIKPPRTITRRPRSIEEWKMWKASEWRSWLLFYAPVCLQGLLPSKYIHHLVLLSTALHLLLRKSITFDDVQLANLYLRKYVFLTQRYYGKTAMLYNYHLLLHICRGVLCYGPLWTHNAFQFEGENRHFMQMRTSSGHVVKQLVRRYSIFTQFPILTEMYASSEQPLEFLNEITGKSLKSFVREDGCVLTGKGRSLPSLSVENCVRVLLVEYPHADVIAFENMFYGGIRYCTHSYAEDKMHDDSFISLGANKKARIDNILQIKFDGETASIVLVVTPLTVRLPNFLKTNIVNVVHVKEIVKIEETAVIKPTMILGQCVYMKYNDREFVADIPFGCYGD